jgi:hypothetical protein
MQIDIMRCVCCIVCEKCFGGIAMFELNNLFKYVSVINETNNELTLQAKGEPDKVVGETWFILDKYNFEKVTLVGEDNATHTFEKTNNL